MLASLISISTEKRALRETVFLATLILAFAAQLIGSLRVSIHPHSLNDQREMAALVVVFFLIGIARSWELIGGPQVGLAHELKQLRRTPSEGHAMTVEHNRTIATRDGQVVIVTGADSPIGLELTRRVAETGARVIIATRSPVAGEQAAALIRRGPPGGATGRPAGRSLATLVGTGVRV